MNDKITDALAAVAATLGHKVEIDRAHEVGEKDCPIIVIRSGDEEAVDFEGRDVVSWDRIWKTDPTIEIYFREPETSKQRALLSDTWSQLRTALDGSPVFDLMAHGYPPEVRKERVITDSKSIVGLAVDFGIFFEL